MATLQALAAQQERKHAELMELVIDLAQKAGLKEDSPEIERLQNIKPSVTQPLATQVEQTEALIDILTKLRGGTKAAQPRQARTPTLEEGNRESWAVYPGDPRRGAAPELPDYVSQEPADERDPAKESAVVQPPDPKQLKADLKANPPVPFGGEPEESRSVYPGEVSDRDAEEAFGRPPMTDEGPLGWVGTSSEGRLIPTRPDPTRPENAARAAAPAEKRQGAKVPDSPKAKAQAAETTTGGAPTPKSGAPVAVKSAEGKGSSGTSGAKGDQPTDVDSEPKAQTAKSAATPAKPTKDT